MIDNCIFADLNLFFVMAELERIRRRSGLLVGIIGFAIVAFVLGDLLGSGNSIFRGDAAVVGKINGRTIEVVEFSKEMTAYEVLVKQSQQQNGQNANFTQMQIVDGVWNKLISEEVLESQYGELGFECTSKELYERLKSNPNIQNAPAFQDQFSKTFSESLMQEYVSNIKAQSGSDDAARKEYENWLNFEDGTIEDTRSRKYTTAIEKGLYYPKNLVKINYAMDNNSSTGKFLVQEFSSIADSTIEVSTKDLQNYLNDHKEDFQTEQSRDIEFVSFAVVASEEDLNDALFDLEKLLKPMVVKGDTLESFITTKDDSSFAIINSELPTYPSFYRRSNIPAPLDSTLFDQDLGYIKGPYLDGDYYRLTKITDRKELPDSAEARHILISYQGATRAQTDRTYQDAEALADSLFEVVKADTSLFASLAKDNSDDSESAVLGGKLAKFDDKSMVKVFSDFCFNNDPGSLKIVPSPFGFHIIEVLGHGEKSEAIELVTISRRVEISDDTYNVFYDEASRFASNINSIEEFRTKAEESSYLVRPVTNIAEFQENISGIGPNAREIVKWTYEEESKVGDIQLFQPNSAVATFAVTILTNKKEEGLADLASVEEEVKKEVILEKKAEILIKKINEAKLKAQSINELASALNTSVKDQVVNFSGAVISGYGTEPKVVGALSTVELNTLSQPIVGINGVFVVTAENHVSPAELPDYTAEQTKLISNIAPAVRGGVFTSLKDAAKIKDRRANFY